MAKKMQQRARKVPSGDFFTMLVKHAFNVECVKEYRFHEKRRWRFDYAIPAYKIAVEVEGGVWTGGRHVSATGFLGDMEKYNTATMKGWRVLRCTPKGLVTAEMMEMIKETMKTTGGKSDGK